MTPKVPVGLLARLFQSSAEMWRAISKTAKDDKSTGNLIKIMIVQQIPVYLLIISALILCILTGLR